MKRATIILLALFAQTACADTPEAVEHTPASALAAIQLADETLDVELVAAEPDVIDPVAMAWDEAGRMYVAEMRDYPLGPAGGTVRLLEDRDGDGRYEKATVFAEGLAFPNSVMPWRGGVFVSAAPDILYLKDLNADGKADERRVVLTGFAEGNQQLRVNSLHLGLDGWVYAANGRSDGVVRRPEEPEDKAVPLRRHDLRFNPDTFAFEPIAGFSQFGLCHDDWGNRFLSWNTVPIRHAVIEESTLAKNPLLAVANVEAVVSDPADTGRIYPLAAPVPRFNRESVEFFNASCGLTIYRGDQLEQLRGDALLCEPLSSLVHHKALTPAGATFVAKRVEQGQEFLASTDAWFRPVNLATGPDGNLYIADFARKWVEHPDFVPKDMRAGVDWRAGESLGRIWRVRKKGAPLAAHLLVDLDTAGLVNALEDANGWVRDTAQRLLTERHDTSLLGKIGDLSWSGKSPEARLQALNVAANMGGVSADTLSFVMLDQDSRVRRGALQLAADGRIALNMEDACLAAMDDPDPQVRFMAAIAGTGLPASTRLQLIHQAAARPCDSWMVTALLCLAHDESSPFLTALLRDTGLAPAALLSGLAELAGAQNDTASLSALAEALQTSKVEVTAPVVAGLLRGLDRAKADAREFTEDNALTSRLEPYLIALIADETQESARRLEAVALVRRGIAPGALEALPAVLHDTGEQALRIAVAQVLAAQPNTTALAGLFSTWESLPVAARRVLVTACTGNRAAANTLLDALEAGQLSAREIDPQSRDVLAKFPEEKVRTRNGKLVPSSGSADRKDVVAHYGESLKLTGDATHGAVLFEQNCMPCHRYQGKGNTVGPDLSGIVSRAREQLVSDIFDPSAEVAPDYAAYTAVVNGLDVVTGVLASETANAITLRQAQGLEQVILRAELSEFRASQLSLMPEGFETNLDIAAFADLLSFLRGGK